MDEPVVYVVDDDPSVCRALSRLLHSVGLEALTSSAKQALTDLLGN